MPHQYPSPLKRASFVQAHSMPIATKKGGFDIFLVYSSPLFQTGEMGKILFQKILSQGILSF
jgi:hypothetical protein